MPKCSRCRKSLVTSISSSPIITSSIFSEIARQPRACTVCNKNFCSQCAVKGNKFYCPDCGNYLGEVGDRPTFIVNAPGPFFIGGKGTLILLIVFLGFAALIFPSFRNNIKNILTTVGLISMLLGLPLGLFQEYTDKYWWSILAGVGFMLYSIGKGILPFWMSINITLIFWFVYANIYLIQLIKKGKSEREEYIQIVIPFGYVITLSFAYYFLFYSLMLTVFFRLLFMLLLGVLGSIGLYKVMIKVKYEPGDEINKFLFNVILAPPIFIMIIRYIGSYSFFSILWKSILAFVITYFIYLLIGKFIKGFCSE